MGPSFATTTRRARALTGRTSNLVACGMLPRSALAALTVLALATAATGCVTRLDMTSVYDADRPATTFPYASVRGARQFADYEAIGQSILTGSDPWAAATGAPKAGKPKGGSK